jgi:uncharacterized protein
MAAIGADLRGHLFRRLFQGNNPAGPGIAVAVAVGLLILNVVLQIIFSVVIQFILFGSAFGNFDNSVRGALLGVLPAALLTGLVAWQAAKLRGGNPRDVLNLHWPQLGTLGWIVVIVGFFLCVFVLFAIVLGLLKIVGIEQSPGGLVEEAMAGLAKDPSLYLLVLPSVILGAPLVEELIFRGQIFTALSQTRLGFIGTTLLTSVAWALMHYSGNWILVGLIFIMGLVLGWLLYRFGSLWVTLACHAIWNTSTSLVIFAALAP